jgi:hypothetical protein
MKLNREVFKYRKSGTFSRFFCETDCFLSALLKLKPRLPDFVFTINKCLRFDLLSFSYLISPPPL